ncbi:DUF7534 family protein [Halalkalicoccus tibetensis]|uniref:Uncharacterized protein n=1 Tax=Halalkalicoccus tibetensis TaxID=175632 RepID=A0ABD5UX66_9EURY
MDRSLWTRFLVVVSLLITLGFAVSAMVTPPDPATQALVLPVILLVAIPLSYWVVYRGGLPV